MKREAWVGPLLFVLLGLYLGIFCLPKRLPMTDEGTTLVLASEIARGHALYSDLDWEYPPLAFFAHALWMRWMGPGVFEGRILILAIALATFVVSAWGARSFLPPTAALVAAAAVVLSVFPYQFYASYNLHAVFWSVAAASAILRSPSPTAVFLAGALAGLSFLCKQNLGGLAAMGIFLGALLADGPRRAALAAAGGLLVFGIFLWGVVGRAGIPAFFSQVILGGFEQASHTVASYPLDQIDRFIEFLRSPGPRTLDSMAHSLSFLAPLGVAVLLAPTTVWLRRRGDPLARPAVLLCAMVPLAWLGAAHAPTTWHIIFTRPIPVLGAAFLLGRLQTRTLRAGAYLATAAFFALHLGRQAMILDDYDTPLSEPLARGILLRRDEAEFIDAVSRMLRRIPEKEEFFLAGPDPMYYHLLQRHPPLPWIYLDPPAISSTRRAAFQEALRTSPVSQIVVLYGRSKWYDYRPLLPSSGWKVVEEAHVGNFHIERRERLLGGGVAGPGPLGADSRPRP